MENIFSAFLSKTLNIDESKLSELVKTEDGELKENALDMLLELDAKRVQSLKQVDDNLLKERFENGYAKAKQEVLTNFEKELKSKFGVNEDLKGIDLVETIIKTKAQPKGKLDIDEDVVKAHKAYQDLHQRLSQEKEEIAKQWEQKYNELESNIKRKQTLDVVFNKALEVVNKLNPVLSKDPAKAENQKKLILKELETNNYDVQGDRIVVMDSEGKVLEDNHRNPIKFEDLVSKITTSYFDLQQSEPRSSAGKGEPKDYKNSENWNWNKVAPKSEQEYLQLMKNATSLEEKVAITDAFKSANN